MARRRLPLNSRLLAAGRRGVSAIVQVPSISTCNQRFFKETANSTRRRPRKSTTLPSMPTNGPSVIRTVSPINMGLKYSNAGQARWKKYCVNFCGGRHAVNFCRASKLSMKTRSAFLVGQMGETGEFRTVVAAHAFAAISLAPFFHALTPKA